MSIVDFQNHGSGTSPEVTTGEILRGELAGLSRPILLAAPSQRAARNWARRHGLARDEWRRVRHWWNVPREVEARKVLVLLPGWELDGVTDDLVAQWVADEGYTCDLTRVPTDPERLESYRMKGYVAFLAGAAGIALIELTTPMVPGWLGWAVGAIGFAVARWEGGEA